MEFIVDRYEAQAFVNTVMNVQFTYKTESFASS